VAGIMLAEIIPTAYATLNTRRMYWPLTPRNALLCRRSLVTANDATSTP
jgi:hypothetical protein